MGGSAFYAPTGEFDQTSLANPIALKSHRRKESSRCTMRSYKQKESKA